MNMTKINSRFNSHEHMKSVCNGSTVPQASGRTVMRTGSTGLGRRLLRPPFKPWQRQMGASLMTFLRPAQHVPGGVKTVRLVR
jgi:hypothetical protein